MTTRAAALLLALAASPAGCSLFHRNQPTPQQRFLDALNHGNSVEASQVWLKMAPEDRNKLRRGEGLKPAVPPAEAMKMLSQQPPGEEEGQITIGPNGGASLLKLPSLASPPPSQSAPAPDAK